MGENNLVTIYWGLMGALAVKGFFVALVVVDHGDGLSVVRRLKRTLAMFSYRTKH